HIVIIHDISGQYNHSLSIASESVLISAVIISRLLRKMVNHPTSINLAFIPHQIKDYGVGIPAELTKS
ncbi:MAG: hypothetical protein ACRDBG_13965, partial [Waterburya sp.]